MKHPDEMTDAELVSDAIRILANRVSIPGDPHGPETVTDALWMCANALVDIREAINNLAQTIAARYDQ